MKKLLTLSLIILFSSCQKEDNSSLIEQQQAQIQSYLKQVDELKTEISSITSLVSNLQSQVSSLQNSNSELNSQVSSLQNSNSELNSQVSSLQNSNSELNSQVSSQVIEIQQLNESLSSISSSYEELQATYNNLLSNNNDLESTNQSLNELILSLQEQIESLSTAETTTSETTTDETTTSETTTDETTTSETTTDETSTSETTTEETTTYQVTITVSGNGSTSISTDTYNEGQQISITASSDSGNRFINWSGDISSTDETISITVNSNINISANFEVIPSYTVSVNSGTGGSISSSGGTYQEGDTVTITATPNTGYTFNNWTGGVESSSNEITLTVNADITVTANFNANQYTLNVNSGTGGSVSSSGGTYNYGDTVTITATPNTGYIFNNWTGGSSSSNSEITVTINSDLSISAGFIARQTVSLQVNNDNGGVLNYTGNFGSSGSVPSNTNQSITLYENETITFSVTYNLGYYLDSWGGDLSGNEDSKSVTLDSNFDIISTEYSEYSIYAIRVEVQSGGSVQWTSRPYNETNTGGQNQLVRAFYPNEEITLTAIPDSGKTFTEWECTSGCEGNTFGSSETLTITMAQSDIRVIAKFQ